jgi:hypothetical protein
MLNANKHFFVEQISHTEVQNSITTYLNDEKKTNKRYAFNLFRNLTSFLEWKIPTFSFSTDPKDQELEIAIVQYENKNLVKTL